MHRSCPSFHKTLNTLVLLPFLFLTLFLLTGCGSDAADQIKAADKLHPQWTYQPGGLQLRLRADPLQNLYDDEGHTVVLCVYQLTTPNKFNSLAKTRAGVVKLLQCDQAFDDSAVTFEKIIVQPSEDKTFTMDRAEKAKYVGVAAGFYTLDPKRSTRLFQYPVNETDDGFFTTDITRTPGKLLVNLFLGPAGIQKVGSD